MRIKHEANIGLRVPPSLRKRLDRIGKLKLKSTSEMAREALREYAERHEGGTNTPAPAQ